MKHFDAGLGSRLRKHQQGCAWLQNDERFIRFLEALGHHVSQSMHHDSTSHPLLNWWSGSHVELFWDTGCQASFDHSGRKRLAKSLAESTLKLMRLHRALDDKRFLGKRQCSGTQREDEPEAMIAGPERSALLNPDTMAKEGKNSAKSTAWGDDPWQPGVSLNQGHQL